jgi:hypothetical protein
MLGVVVEGIAAGDPLDDEAGRLVQGGGEMRLPAAIGPGIDPPWFGPSTGALEADIMSIIVTD